MVNGTEEPEPVAPELLINLMRQRGGVSRLIAVLLAFGVGEAGNWDAGRLNLHLALMDDRAVLDRSTEILATAVDENVIDELIVALIDAALETYDQRDSTALLAWVHEHGRVAP